jgi:hypothetical protein
VRHIKIAVACAEWSVWTELRGGGPAVCCQSTVVSHQSRVARWPLRRSSAPLAVSGRGLEDLGFGSRAFCRSSLPRSTLFLSPMVRTLDLSEVLLGSRRMGPLSSGTSSFFLFISIQLQSRPVLRPVARSLRKVPAKALFVVRLSGLSCLTVFLRRCCRVCCIPTPILGLVAFPLLVPFLAHLAVVGETGLPHFLAIDVPFEGVSSFSAVRHRCRLCHLVVLLPPDLGLRRSGFPDSARSPNVHRQFSNWPCQSPR